MVSLMDLDQLLWEAVDAGASDLHLRAGAPPVMRVDGSMFPFDGVEPLSAADTSELARHILRDHQVDLDFQQEVDVNYSVRELGRFRVNIFTHGGQVGVVLRIMPPEPLGIDELNLPNVLNQLAEEERGLVLVTGITGSGKSTTLAAMIDHINRNRRRHIITIEDPVEYVHRDHASLVTQRQLGLDTQSFASALRAALRQDPDVILIGEMRDLETINAAVTAAETGHLVFSTLHTVDATETLNRILAAYPPHQQEQVRMQLAEVLRGVVSQRLLPRADGQGLVPAVEVMLTTKYVAELIRDSGRTHKIRDVIADSASQYGMQTFDQSLLDLCERGLITEEIAISAATSPNDLKLALRGITSGQSRVEHDYGADDHFAA